LKLMGGMRLYKMVVWNISKNMGGTSSALFVVTQKFLQEAPISSALKL